MKRQRIGRFTVGVFAAMILAPVVGHAQTHAEHEASRQVRAEARARFAAEQGTDQSSKPDCPDVGNNVSAVDIEGVISRSTTDYVRGGKSDQVQKLKRPKTPRGDLKAWLTAHGADLQAAIASFYSSGDMDRFLAAESGECGNNVFCQLAYRQSALSLIVNSVK